MGNPTTELQQLTNKSIIELFSVELKADVHYVKSAKTNCTYTQSGTTITITLNSHGLTVGTILTLDFHTGGAADGIYTIQTVATNTFTVTAIVSQSITGSNTVSFNVNSVSANPTVYLFHAGNNMKNSGDIIWQSNTYSRMPCKAEGFKYSGKGKLPRPTISFSNLLGTITAIIQLTNNATPLPFTDLAGAKITRRRTLARFLDEANFPSNVNPYKVGSVDPTAEMPQEIYFIDRKIVENRDIVQFELVSTFDLIGIAAPKKLVTREDFPGVGTFVNF
jgi:lambda family phage minor tail protein L